jgi:hypothetical protein
MDAVGTSAAHCTAREELIVSEAQMERAAVRRVSFAVVQFPSELVKLKGFAALHVE